MIRLTRRYRFSASHRLDAPQLTSSENAALYGKCNNPYGHGHDYVLEVRVEGPVDAATGQALRVSTLDTLVATEVLQDFEYRYFNLDVPEFAELVPTSENIATVIDQRLRRGWPEAFPGGLPYLDSIRLLETERNLFELSMNPPHNGDRAPKEATNSKLDRRAAPGPVRL